MNKIIDKTIRKRTDKLVGMFEDYVKEGAKVLDIGAGGGWIGQEIQKRKNANVVLLDTIDFNRTSLKSVLYDGEKIPFPDGCFDASLLVFVLHHCQNPLNVLTEAKRASRDKIIVIEDIPASLAERILLCFWDIFAGLPSLIKPPGENIAFNFKAVSEWRKIFDKLNLKIIFQKEFRSACLVHHALFVLQKSD